MKKEKKEELVLYKNKLNLFGLKNLTSVELDLWWVVINKIKDRETNVIEVDLRDFVELGGYDVKNKNYRGMKRDLYRMSEKVMMLNTEEVNEKTGDFLKFVLFPSFEVEDKKLYVQISEHFEGWFNRLGGNFTKLNLLKMTNLKGTYVKEFYRFLSGYIGKDENLKENEGYWWVKVDKFRELMNIPETYRWNDIEQKVIEQSKKQLIPKIFSRIDLEKVKKGRRVDFLKFSFELTENNVFNKEEEEKINNENVIEITDWSYVL